MNSILVLLFAAQISQAQFRPQFSCLNGFNSKISQAMRSTAQRISVLHGEFASAIGFGRCLNLPETMVLRVAGFQIPGLPEECLGITIGSARTKELKAKALRILKTQSEVIDGRNGAALIRVNGVRIAIPICMESFEGGSPQSNNSF